MSSSASHSGGVISRNRALPSTKRCTCGGWRSNISSAMYSNTPPVAPDISRISRVVPVQFVWAAKRMPVTQPSERSAKRRTWSPLRSVRPSFCSNSKISFAVKRRCSTPSPSICWLAARWLSVSLRGMPRAAKTIWQCSGSQRNKPSTSALTGSLWMTAW